jgi:hypothetical protein
MRKVAVLLIVLGIAGLVLGSTTIIRTMQAPGTVPFSLESYGGPGPIVGALLLFFAGWYLLSSAGRED